MPAIPSGTKFIGISPNVPTPENKSSLSNSYQETYTIDDIVAEASALDTNIYNTDGTIDGDRIVDLNGNTLKFDDGSVGVNVTPNAPLHVQSKAVPSFNEAIARFTVSDAPGADLTIINASTTNGVFVPEISGQQGLNPDPAFKQTSYINPTQDSGAIPVTIFAAALNTLAAIVTRPLYQFRNAGTNLLTILANGNIGIGTATPSEKLEVNGKTKTTNFQMTASPTAGYVLTSDASGNGSWQTPPVTSGRFGISDSNGVYTYYSTLQAAITAATSGQTVEFFTDATDSTSTPVELKVGVNINGNGHTYNHTSNSGATFTITDTAGTKNGDVNFFNLNIKRTTTSSAGDPIFTVSSTYTFIYNNFNFFGCNVSYTSTSGNTIVFKVGALGRSTVNGLICTTNGSGFAIDQSSGVELNTNNCYVICNGTGSGITSSGGGVAKNCIVEITSGVAYSGYLVPYECTAYSTTSGTCFTTQTAYNCTAYSNTGKCFDGSGWGASTAFNCLARTTSGICFYSCIFSSSSAFATTGLTIGLHFNYGADVYKMYNNYFNVSSAAAIDISSVYIMDSSVVCTWDNASGHGVKMSGTTGAICNCAIEVGNSSANCINSAAASTLKYSNNSFKGSTTAVNANVTQGISNSPDSKGNILI